MYKYYKQIKYKTFVQKIEFLLFVKCQSVTVTGRDISAVE